MMNQCDQYDREGGPDARKTHVLAALARNGQAMGRSLVLAISVLLPFGMGVRECERVPIGDQCADGGTGGACGCDYEGKHYDNGESFKSADGCNDCGCQEDGTVVCTLKLCVPDGGTSASCGGLTGAQCGDGEFCDFAIEATCGAADQTGTCKPKPDACTLQLDPVCGCDDVTYGNACAAAAAGVSVAKRGECAAAGGGEACEYEGKKYAVGDKYPAADGCNTCTCQKDGGSACTEIGCNQPRLCGSRGLTECEDGEYCKYEPEAICGAADAPGTCTKITQACTREYKPVCGCDDKTYGNACTAAAASVSVLHEGECEATGCDYEGTHYEVGAGFPSSDGCNSCSCMEGGMVACTLRACAPQGQTCGGLTGASCPDKQYCNFPPEAICGAADGTGVCAPIPEACTAQYDPVCGCDDKTYGNACEAAAAGVTARVKGECGVAAPGCDYNRVHYEPGASFPSSDGCNSCSCQDDGTVVCTLRACAPTQKVCGGFAGSTCSNTEYCNYPRDAMCGIADATGVCAPRPDVCTSIFQPVCGCDGNDYPNECEASVAGIGVMSVGECP